MSHDTVRVPQTVISWAITESPSGEATLVQHPRACQYTISCKNKADAEALRQKLLARLRAAEKKVCNG